MRSKQSFTFEHEGVQTAPTKIPKFNVKYSRKQKPIKTTTETAVQTAEQTASQGYTLGEAPANVYSMTTYSPLVQQVPGLISPSTVSSTGTFSSVGSMNSPEQERLNQQLQSARDWFIQNGNSPAQSSVSSMNSQEQERLLQQLQSARDWFIQTVNSPAQVSPIPEEIQRILDQTAAYENFQNQITNAGVWNGEGMPVFRRPNPPSPIITRPRPPPGFYRESPTSSSNMSIDPSS